MCMNKRIDDHELEQLVVAATSDIHGTGLFSARFIHAGEYIGSFHGPIVEEDGEHVLWIEDTAADCGYIGIQGKNLLRYLNHDSSGNVEFFGLELYARIDIPSGEEITLDYAG